MACLVHRKIKDFFFLVSKERRNKDIGGKKEYQKQPSLRLSSAKEKDGTRAQTHVSKVWQQRGEER